MQKAVKSLETLKVLFTHKEFVKRFLLIAYPWFCIGMTSYGLGFSVRLVKFDIFITSVIKNVVLFFVIILLIPAFEKLQRAPLLFVCYVLNGLAAIGYFIIPPSFIASRVTMYIIATGLASSSFFLVDAYTPEVFSTDSRNFAFSLLDSISKLGTTIAPFIVDLGSTNDAGIPIAVFGCVMLSASAIFLFTPETNGKPLAQNLNDLAYKWTDTMAERLISLCK